MPPNRTTHPTAATGNRRLPRRQPLSLRRGLGEVFVCDKDPDLGLIFAPVILGPIPGLAVLPVVIRKLPGAGVAE